MATSTIRIKTDTTANWQATNRVLEYKEIAIEVRTNGKKAFKTGDGVTGWNKLPYLFDPEWVEKEVSTANGQTRRQRWQAARRFWQRLQTKP